MTEHWADIAILLLQSLLLFLAVSQGLRISNLERRLDGKLS